MRPEDAAVRAHVNNTCDFIGHRNGNESKCILLESRLAADAMQTNRVEKCVKTARINSETLHSNHCA